MTYIDNFGKLDWALEFNRTGKFPLDRSSMFGSYADALAYARQDGTDTRKIGGTSYVGQIISVFGPGVDGVTDEIAAYIITAVGTDATLMKFVQSSASGDVEDEIQKLAVRITEVEGKLKVASAKADGLLSKENFTKLLGIAPGAQVNIIESVKVNGEALEIADKAVNIDLSTATNLENGTGTGSLVQKRLKSDGVTWTTAKAYQGAGAAFGGGTQAGKTEEEFNAYFWDSINNVPLHGGAGKNSSGEILDNHSLTYKKSYSFGVAEGEQTKSLGRGSHSEGYSTKTEEEYSHAEGWKTVSRGLASHSEGSQTNAIGKYSHAEGFGTSAKGAASHSEGMSTEAIGDKSHVEGFATRTLEMYQHVEGVYNADNPNALHIVGNGTSENARKNAFVVLKDGRAKVQSAPTENDDVVRLNELFELTQEQVDSLF